MFMPVLARIRFGVLSRLQPPPLPLLHNLHAGGQTLPPHPGTKSILENTPVNLGRCGLKIATVPVRWQAENHNNNSIIET